MSVNTRSKAGHASPSLASSHYRDEISLFDLWGVLLSRRWWMLSVWLVTLLAAVAYLSVAQPVFQSRAVVQVGRVGGSLITPVPALVLALHERYQVGEPDRERPLLASVKGEGEDALVLVAEADSAHEAQQFLEGILQTLFAAQQKRYATGLALQEAALAAVDAQISGLKGQIQRLGETANSNDVDEAVKALLILQRSSLQVDLSALNQQQFRLQQDLSLLKSYPSEAIRQPTLAERASKPRPMMVLVLALVLGGILGCAAAFVVSFLQEANKKAKSAGAM
jgi:hypothetical protein